MAFENSSDYKDVRKCLIKYGIQEPYATNILHRVFYKSFEVIKQTEVTIK